MNHGYEPQSKLRGIIPSAVISNLLSAPFFNLFSTPAIRAPLLIAVKLSGRYLR
jgi:hypothetical protein